MDLELHGLSAAQIATIETERKLLRDLAIVTPDIDSHDKTEEMRLSRLPFRPVSFQTDQKHVDRTSRHPLIIEDLKIQKGQGVMSGEMLCSLSNFRSSTLRVRRLNKTHQQSLERHRMVG